ncbi:hypothetical protein KAU51_00325 [Candidatus Parcubacteria bacterium]|nr:hypothetical protein [Candidatus Parcubacteria bacterium]
MNLVEILQEFEKESKIERKHKGNLLPRCVDKGWIRLNTEKNTAELTSRGKNRLAKYKRQKNNRRG